MKPFLAAHDILFSMWRDGATAVDGHSTCTIGLFSHSFGRDLNHLCIEMGRLADWQQFPLGSAEDAGENCVSERRAPAFYACHANCR